MYIFVKDFVCLELQAKVTVSKLEEQVLRPKP
jgi:hypothetical protein